MENIITYILSLLPTMNRKCILVNILRLQSIINRLSFHVRKKYFRVKALKEAENFTNWKFKTIDLLFQNNVSSCLSLKSLKVSRDAINIFWVVEPWPCRQQWAWPLCPYILNGIHRLHKSVIDDKTIALHGCKTLLPVGAHCVVGYRFIL